VTPADVPEDAAGRVLFVAPTLPPDDEMPLPIDSTDAHPEPAPTEDQVAGGGSSWTAVVLLGVAIVVLFIVGMGLFR
jgi:hypothetical protein